VHVYRTACPWLIKIFVDSKAEFLFVPVEKIQEIMKKEKVIPYDAPNVELTHHAEKCSFDAIIEKYKIDDPAILACKNRASDRHGQDGDGSRSSGARSNHDWNWYGS
jgi:hypothetical protein